MDAFLLQKMLDDHGTENVADYITSLEQRMRKAEEKEKEAQYKYDRLRIKEVELTHKILTLENHIGV